MKRSEALGKLKTFLEDVNLYMRDLGPEEAILQFFETELDMRHHYRKWVSEPIVWEGKEIGTSDSKEDFWGWEPE